MVKKKGAWVKKDKDIHIKYKAPSANEKAHISVLEEYVFPSLQIFRVALDSNFLMISLKNPGKSESSGHCISISVLHSAMCNILQ